MRRPGAEGRALRRGYKVDLNTLAFLSPHFRDRVEAEAVPLYEAA